MAGGVHFVIGIVLVGIGLAMIWLGRARHGEPVPFMQNELVGMIYVLVCLALMVAGGGLIISAVLPE
jgi:hypothetical protein